MNHLKMLGTALVLALASGTVADEGAPVSAAPKPPAMSGAPVRITLADGSRALRVERLVKAPIADVWNAWGTSEGLSKALGKQVTVEPRLGGKFEIFWKPDAPAGERGSEGCTVQAWVPQRLIAFTWNAPPQFGELRKEHSLVVVEMDEVGKDLVRVRLTHHAFGTGEGWDGIYDYFSEAWPRVMDTVCASLGGALTDAREKQQAWCYVVTPSRADFFETLTDADKQTLGAHFVHIRDATEAGQVIFGGPFTDAKIMGIVVFYADSPESATAFMQSDPAVKAGLFTAEVHPIAVSVVRERDRIKP